MSGFDEAHEERAFFYSSLAFLHNATAPLAEEFLTGLASAERKSQICIIGTQARCYIRRLEWDSHYFACPAYRLEFTDWDTNCADPVAALAQTLTAFKTDLAAQGVRYYLSAEIPSEDTVTLQALGMAGAKLVETRLTYFRDNLAQFVWSQRAPVRLATVADIPHLREVAKTARNSYDRYHADPFFPDAVADDYLATFIENSVQGFADIVLVPADDNGAAGAFFTANLLPPTAALPGVTLGRIVLVAVGQERRGWHLKLMAEMSYRLQGCGVQVAFMTTQSTNRAVIRNCEKLGYRYGRSTHVFAIHR